MPEIKSDTVETQVTLACASSATRIAHEEYSYSLTPEDYRRAKPEGTLALAPTALAKQTRWRRDRQGYRQVIRDYANCDEYVDWVVYDPPSTYCNQDLLVWPQTNSVTKVRNEIEELKYSFSNHIAEYKETVGMLTQAVQNALSVVRRARKNPKAVFKMIRDYGQHTRGGHLSLRNIPSTILYANFGINPLIADVAEAVSYVAPVSPVIRVAAGDKATNDGTYSREFARYRRDYVVSNSVHEVTVAYVRLNQSWKPWTLGDPLEVGWEWMPWSWAIDYMSNVGDWISSLDALSGVDVLAATTSWTRERTVTSSVVGTTSPTDTYQVQELQPGNAWHREHERKLASLGVTFSQLRLEPSLSVNRVMNLLSALTLRVVDADGKLKLRRQGR